MTTDNQIIIFDTTLRDGEQSPGASMNQAEKLRIATQLEALGVNVIEAGFPAASDGDFEAVKAIAETLKVSEIAALCRADGRGPIAGNLGLSKNGQQASGSLHRGGGGIVRDRRRGR